MVTMGWLIKRERLKRHMVDMLGPIKRVCLTGVEVKQSRTIVVERET